MNEKADKRARPLAWLKPIALAMLLTSIHVDSARSQNKIDGDGGERAIVGAVTENLRLTLPPRCFALVGQPLSIYFDNLVLTQTPERYRFEVKLERDGQLLSAGTQEQRRWTFTPQPPDVGLCTMRLTVFDNDNRKLGTATSQLLVTPADAGSGRKLALLIIGDSLTHATVYPNELAKLLSQPGNPTWTMFGTHRPTSAAPGVAHEGYGGWTWEAFESRYFAKPDVAKRQHSSPFVFADNGGQPRLNPAKYFDEHCGGQRPDVIVFLLGINDCFSAPPTDLEKLDERIDIVFKHADKVFAAMRAAAPSADLVICLTTPPNARQKAFEANYQDRYTRWGWKQIQHRLVEREIKHFGGREQERIFLAPTELNVDPVDGYPENNAVHPNAVGYGQIAQTIYVWVKWRLAGAQTAK